MRLLIVAATFSWALASLALGDLMWGRVQELHAEGAPKDWSMEPMGSAVGGVWGGEGGKGRSELIRNARALVYPGGGVYKFIMGLGVPVPVPNKTLAFGFNFQFQYGVPTNASQLSWPVVVSARRARRSRAALYKAVEATLDRKGLPGKACLLKAICEVAETPLLHDGLLGELFHLLLTPSLGQSDAELLKEYRAAEEAGVAGEDCSRLYSNCTDGSGLLDHITCIHHLSQDEEEEEEALRTPPPHWDFLEQQGGSR